VAFFLDFLLLLLLSMMKVMRGRRNRQKTRAQTRKSLSLFLSFSRVLLVVVVNNYSCRSLVSSRDDDDDDAMETTNERTKIQNYALSFSVQTTTKAQQKKKIKKTPRSSLPLKASLSLSLLFRVFLCALYI